MTKEQLLESAKSLSREDQIELAMELWDRIEFPDAPLSDEMKRELDRRIEADDRNTDKGEEWEVLREKLLRGEI